MDIIISLIEELEGLINCSNNKNLGEEVMVQVQNNMSNSMPPKKFSVKLYLGMSLQQIKSVIAPKLNPPQSPGDIQLITRGSILQENNCKN